MELEQNIEEILLKDITNQGLTHREHIRLRTWLGESQKNKSIYSQMKMTFLYPEAKNMQKIREEVWSDLQNKAAGSFTDKIRINHFWFKAAATLIVGLTIGILLYEARTVEITKDTVLTEVQLLQKESLPGQKISTVLPDGSIVKLNAGSRIFFSENFTGDTREVTLYGEAFFDVVGDEGKPFVVTTRDIHVQVIGTSFNVKSYTGTESTVVSVASGKVAVTDPNHHGIDLISGEKISYQSNSGLMVKEQYVWEEEFGWKDNILVFKGSNFSEISEILSNWYGVEFIVKGKMPDSNKKFSGKYNNPTLKAVLEGLSYVYDFGYHLDKKKVVLLF